MTAPTRADTAGRAYLDLRSLARSQKRPVDELHQLYVLEAFLDRLREPKNGVTPADAARGWMSPAASISVRAGRCAARLPRGYVALALGASRAERLVPGRGRGCVVQLSGVST